MILFLVYSPFCFTTFDLVFLSSSDNWFAFDQQEWMFNDQNASYFKDHRAGNILKDNKQSKDQ